MVNLLLTLLVSILNRFTDPQATEAFYMFFALLFLYGLDVDDDDTSPVFVLMP